jgi:hypothetical protein
MKYYILQIIDLLLIFVSFLQLKIFFLNNTNRQKTKENPESTDTITSEKI